MILPVRYGIIITGYYAFEYAYKHIIVLLNLLVKRFGNFKYTLFKIYSLGEVILLFYDNLKAICDKQKVKITPIVLECGGNKGSLSGWKKGAMPNSDIVMKLAVRLNVPTDCLLFGENYNLLSLSEVEKELLNYYNELDPQDKGSVLGKAEGLAEAARRRKAELEAAKKEKTKPKPTAVPLPAPEPEPNEDIDEEENETEYIYLPFFDLPVSAGTGVYLDSEDAKKIRVPADETTRKADYVLRVSGDSMEPRYYDGDIVLVRQQQFVEEGEVGIFSYNDEGYIKIFGGNCLISLNPKYKDKIIGENDQFFCLGKVMGILSIGNKRK